MLRMALISFSLLAFGCAYFACGLVLGKQATAVVGNGSTTSAARCSGGCRLVGYPLLFTTDPEE
jgi:hypothetical protein